MMDHIATKAVTNRGLVCLCTVILFLQGCMYSAVPQSSVNEVWLAKNCTALPYKKLDSCSNFTNCSSLPSEINLCRCKDSNGNYEGTVSDGKWHGFGKYYWTSEGKFVGLWKEGKQWCGVEQNSNGSFLFLNGSYTKQQVGVNWEDTLLLILAAGVAAALIESGGAGGGSTTVDYDYDWDAFNDEYGNLVWRCRGIQTGQFAKNNNCLYDIKDDDRWPGR